MRNHGRALVVHQGALGDFLLILPAIEGLHRIYPHLRIDFQARAEHLTLISHRDYFGSAHPTGCPELTPFYHEDLWRDAPLPVHFLEREEIFIFGQEGARVVSERLSVRLGRRVRWVRSFPAQREQAHVSCFILDQFREMGFPLGEWPVRLTPREEEKKWVEEWFSSRGWLEQRRRVMIHPGSGGIGKIWPLRNWRALLEWLNRVDVGPVLMSLGPGDDVLKDFSREVGEKGVVVLENLPLARLAAFLARAEFYVGSDSGVSHLASSMGVPAFVIFGPTDPVVWAPRNPNAFIIEDDWDRDEVLAQSGPNARMELNPRVRRILEEQIIPCLTDSRSRCASGPPGEND